jgi:metal-responsive CopG/Arc/MetJ family transcriptional regulator
MRTVQMTLDEELLASVDKAAKKLKTRDRASLARLCAKPWIVSR